MWAALSPLVLWLAAIAAYAYEDGMNLFQWMGRFSQVLERPFAIGWTPYTLKYMLVGLLLYGCGIALYYCPCPAYTERPQSRRTDQSHTRIPCRS